MALNQLQYMSLSMSVIKYDDMRQRLLTSAKDEDISPFTAVDKYDFYLIFASWFLHELFSLSSILLQNYSLSLPLRIIVFVVCYLPLL